MSITGSCPTQGSGKFYVCQGNTTEFIGCCTIDPCADGKGICPSANLGHTSFNADDYDAILPQMCASSGDWYTCMGASTAFMGCCKTNACDPDGCPDSDLTAAVLSTNTTAAAPFMTSTVPTTSTTDALPSVTSTASNNSTTSSDEPSVSTGAIVGIAIGSAIVALIIGSIAWFILHKRRHRKYGEPPGTVLKPDADNTPGLYVPSPYQELTDFPNSPPTHYGGAYGSDKSFGYPHSPGQIQQEQRPASFAPSWNTAAGSTTGHALGHQSHPSVSSVGSQDGLNIMFNQQRLSQNLDAVVEMDSTPASRPVSELPGSRPMSDLPDFLVPGQEGVVYGKGYTRVAN